ncbi:MAG: DUF4350 domain-containing protein [Desulfurococcaceae archaeon]
MKKAALVLLFAVMVFVFVALEGNVPGTTYAGASPLNTGWDGTSNMVELLSMIGERVIIVEDWDSLAGATVNAGSEYCNVIVVVSPEKPFNDVELNVMRELVLNKSYCLIVLDEGPYGNQVLKFLKVPLEIRGYEYIVDEEGSYVVWGTIEVYGARLRVAFAYASPVRVHDNKTCRYVGYVDGIPIGALCRLSNSSVLVLGDGTLATNSALTPLNEYNPYTLLLRGIISEVCRGIGTTRGKVFLVEGSKYNARILTPREVLASDMPFSEKLKLLINPARYTYQLIVTIERETCFFTCLNVAALIVMIMLVVRLRRRGNSKVEEGKGIIGYSWYGLPIPLIRSLCSETRICPEEFSCTSKKKITRKCKKIVQEKIVSERELRRRIVKTLFIQLYGAEVLGENEVIL